MVYTGVALIIVGFFFIGWGSVPNKNIIRSDGTEIIEPQIEMISGIDQDGNFWFTDKGHIYTVKKVEGDRPMYEVRYKEKS